MRILLTGILIFVNFILQTTLLPYISIGGILPNTALIIVVSYALLRDSTEGAIVGFFSGLPIDIFFGTSFGYYTLLFLLAGLLIGRSQKDFYRENYLLPIIICSLAAIVYESIIFITGSGASGAAGSRLHSGCHHSHLPSALWHQRMAGVKGKIQVSAVLTKPACHEGGSYA